MSDLNKSYFGEYDIDRLLKRIEAELLKTKDPELAHIFAAAASRFAQVKQMVDVSASKERK